ncbi:unnamed protein product, partial [Effrenium voratum]
DFDKAWSVNAEPVAAAATAGPAAAAAGSFDWAAVFSDEAKTVAAAQEKRGKALAEMTVTGTPGCTLMLLEDHALFVCAQEAVSIDSSMAFLAHGAGTWLLGEKATKLKAKHPEKGFECKWNSDEGLVVLEVDGVAQGHADDKFTIVATNGILWKANNVAIKSLKSHNVASTFTKAKLEK